MKRISCYNIDWEDDRDRTWELKIKSKHLKGTGRIPCIKQSPCQTFLIYTTPDFEIRIWNLKQNKEHLRFIYHNCCISDLFINPEISLLAAGCFDKTMTLWDLKAKKLKKVIECSSYVYSVCINQDSSLAGAACSDGTFYIYQIGSESAQIIKGIHKFHIVAFYFIGNLDIVSFGNDHQIMQWRIGDETKGKSLYRGKEKIVDASNFRFKYCVAGFVNKKGFHFKVIKLICVRD